MATQWAGRGRTFGWKGVGVHDPDLAAVPRPRTQFRSSHRVRPRNRPIVRSWNNWRSPPRRPYHVNVPTNQQPALPLLRVWREGSCGEQAAPRRGCTRAVALRLINPLKSSGHYMYHLLCKTLHSAPQIVFACSVWFSQQKATVSLNRVIGQILVIGIIRARGCHLYWYTVRQELQSLLVSCTATSASLTADRNKETDASSGDTEQPVVRCCRHFTLTRSAREHGALVFTMDHPYSLWAVLGGRDRVKGTWSSPLTTI
jgi:hypothetical protein